MKKSIYKKVLMSLISIGLVVCCLLGASLSASASSYPSLFLDTKLWGVEQDHYAGDYIPLKFTYFPEYKNERITVNIKNSNDEIVASSEKSFSHYSIMYFDYTVNWDTKGYDPGTYEVEVVKEFYSFLEWRTAPRNDTYTIILKDPAGKPKWVKEGGKWACYQYGKKITNRWLEDSVGWCYVGSDGYMKTNCWLKDSVGWCYVGSNGYCVTNKWKKDSVGWCYLDENGRMATNRWIADSVGWCYVGSNGYMKTNAWVKDSVGWCYVGSDGYCVTSEWKKDSVGWCYLDKNGRMAINQWVRDSVGWCYLGEDGYAVTNCWKQDSVGWCYLNANGSMTKNAWVEVDGDRYYCNGNGYRVTGEQTIGGVVYTFDEYGVLVA